MSGLAWASKISELDVTFWIVFLKISSGFQFICAKNTFPH